MELGGICRRWVVLRGAGSVCDPASLAGEPISSLDLSKTGGGGGGFPRMSQSESSVELSEGWRERGGGGVIPPPKEISQSESSMELSNHLSGEG